MGDGTPDGADETVHRLVRRGPGPAAWTASPEADRREPARRSRDSERPGQGYQEVQDAGGALAETVLEMCEPGDDLDVALRTGPGGSAAARGRVAGDHLGVADG
ncbi:hypothetical protein [Actinomadura rubrisoli]|uniref:Uncharacterized protein n=1 Tax=Actinomadura rubrisoli TaxID=2530368 RepID=A0A4R5ARB0_9ACTN|nr:hypothetical protein [Actinomadura rubrisoli]TDD74745.1 hypothetical protein E1298_32320 [Actinomadura rubrisoli]